MNRSFSGGRIVVDLLLAGGVLCTCQSVLAHKSRKCEDMSTHVLVLAQLTLGMHDPNKVAMKLENNIVFQLSYTCMRFL